jgi:hypothetical protein
VIRHVVWRRRDGTAPPLTAPGWTQICSTTGASCTNTVPGAGTYRFATVAVDRWKESVATYSGRRTVR